MTGLASRRRPSWTSRRMEVEFTGRNQAGTAVVLKHNLRPQPAADKGVCISQEAGNEHSQLAGYPRSRVDHRQSDRAPIRSGEGQLR